MSSEYTLQILRVVVAQICQTIGWHSIQSTPLEILVDILHRYLQEITRATYHYTEFYGRIEPNLDDLALAFRDLGINIPDIEEYINYVDPVPCAVDVAKYPLHKESSLNFLKPGSKEVLTRPVHILEHLPPIFPEKEGLRFVKNEIDSLVDYAYILDEHVFEQNDASESSIDVVNINSTSENIFKKPEISEMPIIKPKPRVLFEEEGRPAREITSVMMTSSGFISPAREGKLPDTKEPTIPEYSPIMQPSCSPPPLALSVSSIEKFEKKPKKKIPEKEKKRNSLKHMKMSKGGMMENSPSDLTKFFKKLKGKQKNKEHSDMHSMMPNKIFHTPSNDVTADNDNLPPIQPKENFPLNSENSANLDEIKLSSEPDKQKLHIFKKLSSSKKEREDSTKSPNNLSENVSMPGSSTDPTLQPPKLEPIDTKPFPPLPATDPNVIVVDDEAPSNKSPLPQLPPSFMPNLPTPPIGPLKQHGHKRQRKRQAEQASPLNLSNEKIPRFGDNANFDRSYMTMIPEKVKEKKERKKPKNKESKKPLFSPMMPLQMPRFPSNIMKEPHPLFTPDKPTLQTPDNNMGKMDPALKLPPSLISPSFQTMPALSLFPFYPFPTRPGLIPTTGMFPPLADNPSLSKYLSMMRFPNPLNAADKGMRMSSFFEEEEPSPLPPEIVCNIAPLVPDSMKFNLSPTRSTLPMKSKSSIISPSGPNQMGQKSPTIMPSRSSMGTTITPIHVPHSTSSSSVVTSTPIPAQPPKSKFLEPPIEISDDEKRRSDSEEKETEPKQIPPMSGSFSSNSGISFSANKPISSLINNSNNFNSIISNNANSNTLQNPNSNIFIRNSQINDVSSNNFMQNMEKIDDSSIANVSEGKDKEGKLGRRKDKEHKRGKRGKDGKIKKKKDKKDKSKSKDKAEKRKEREGKRDKDKIKKLKKEKKKEKRTLMSSTTDDDVKHNVIDFNDTSSSVPKLTLKLGLGNSPQHDSPDSRKTSFKSHNDDGRDESFDEGSISRVLADDQRESSPELARISPLVTRPPKQKQSTSEYMGQNNYMHSHSSIENKYVSPATIASTTYASQGVSSNSPNTQQSYSISSTKSQSLSPSVSNIETMHNANFNATRTNLHSHNYLPDKSTEQSLPSVNLFQSSSTSMNHSASQSLTGRGAASSVQTSTNVLQTNTFQLSSAPNNRPSSYIDKTSDSETCAVPAAAPTQPVPRGPGRPRGSGNNHGTNSSTASSATPANVSTTSNNSAVASANQPVHSTDAEGNQVWICPACGRVDDGTPMIGCDGCDAWYHWVCVGIQVPPDDKEDWYCRVCIAKKQEAQGSDKKRKRKKKNKAN